MGHPGSQFATACSSQDAAQREVSAERRARRLFASVLPLWASILLAALAPLRAGATAVSAVPTAPAHAVAAPANEACLMCHRDPDLARNTGSAGSLSVDARSLETSVHGAFECRACHGDVRSAPHTPKPAPVRCASCHRDEGAALAGSVHLGDDGVEAACRRCHGTHAIARATTAGAAACATCHAQEAAEHRASLHGVARANGDTEASTCRDCHGSAHGMLRHEDPRSPVNRANLANTCARCHADRELVTRRRITIPDAVQLFRSSVHGRSKRADAATCNDCHESHNLRRATEPTSSIYRTNIPATCGHCHLRELTAFRSSIHGTALARGVTAAPVCTDCHGEHMIRGPRDADSPVAALHVSETCARCHEATGIRETLERGSDDGSTSW